MQPKDPANRTTRTHAGSPSGSRAPSLRSGEVVAERYEIRGLLGRGGMGAVYEVFDRELELAVALKTLASDGDRKGSLLRQLKREVLLARQVTHENVCRLHDLGRDHDRDLLFATMELLVGETLEARLERVGSVPLEAALRYAEQMTEGLEAAHRAGIVHRDLKTSNVMLVEDSGGPGERAVLTDFGIARPWRGADMRLTEPGAVVGTPAYMAPEQLRGEQPGPRADLYALGVVLYEMTTGHLPFEGLDDPLAKLDKDPVHPSAWGVDLPECWEATILRCLAREPGHRFESARAVAASLDGLLVSSPATSRSRESLPPARDRFFGRSAELKRIGTAFGEGEVRLLTLLGMGGSGKTRLALEYARREPASWPGGVWFCDLTDARTTDGLVSAVARSLEIPLGRSGAVEQIGHAIAARGKALVILDNFEQIVEEGGAIIEAWTHRAEEARFLVTSRTRLSLDEEQVLPVEALDEETATELFVDRALRHRPGWRAGDSDADSLSRLMGHLEGLPLAIELAAARMRLMSPAQIADRMSERFKLLASAGEMTDRHAALRASIDGSWELLHPWEKRSFAQCSLFEGGFTLEAAEEVIDISSFPEAPWTVDVVQALLDKSLLRVETTGGDEPRFSMYASLQEYGAGKLSEEERREGILRHGEHYARYGSQEFLASLCREGGVARARRLRAELDNLVAACRRAVDREAGTVAAVTLQASWAVLTRTGPFLAGLELAKKVIECCPLDLSQEMVCRRVAGQACFAGGHVEEGRHHAERALALAREIGDRRNEASCLSVLGRAHWVTGQMEEARALYSEAIEIAREVGDRETERLSLRQLGVLKSEKGRFEEAWDFYQRALAIAREDGGRAEEGILLGDLGIVCFHQGRLEEACRYYEESLERHQEVGDRTFELVLLGNLAVLMVREEQFERARELFHEVLSLVRKVGQRQFEGITLSNLASLHRDLGEDGEALRLYRQALAIHREVGDTRFEGITLSSLAPLLAEEDEVQAAFLEAQTLLAEVGDHVQLGRLLCSRGAYELDLGMPTAARSSLAEAEALARSVGAGPESDLGEEVARLSRRLEDEAGPPAAEDRE